MNGPRSIQKISLRLKVAGDNTGNGGKVLPPSRLQRWVTIGFKTAEYMGKKITFKKG
jgi:hypothetical protein